MSICNLRNQRNIYLFQMALGRKFPLLEQSHASLGIYWILRRKLYNYTPSLKQNLEFIRVFFLFFSFLPLFYILRMLE